MTEQHPCPNCESGRMWIFHEVSAVPTNSCLQLTTREEAKGFPRGRIALGFCTNCGFIGNVTFNPTMTEYSSRYEATQGYSPTFSAFHRGLAHRLVEECDLVGKDVLEIGCGQGEFLLLLAEMGIKGGVGFDPGYRDDLNRFQLPENIRFIKDFFSEKYARCRADFVCCKMTLEHIGPTFEFVRMLRRTIGDRPRTEVFFQVPDVTRILRDCAFEDIYYEHCSYFGPGSLAHLFQKAGFEVVRQGGEYDGQYLTLLARPGDGSSQNHYSSGTDILANRPFVDSFRQRYAEKVNSWRQRMDRLAMDGKRVVIWGAGSKGVAFLNTFGLGDYVSYAVDINPVRQGYFMAGTGQEIVSPEFLVDYRPDLVIVMNSIYCNEIGRRLEELGVSADVVGI